MVSQRLQQQYPSCDHANYQDNVAPTVTTAQFTAKLEDNANQENGKSRNPLSQSFEESHFLPPQTNPIRSAV
jgi:hypothetical protein